MVYLKSLKSPSGRWLTKRLPQHLKDVFCDELATFYHFNILRSANRRKNDMNVQDGNPEIETIINNLLSIDVA